MMCLKYALPLTCAAAILTSTVGASEGFGESALLADAPIGSNESQHDNAVNTIDPDSFRLPSDGDDDAPAVQRAVNSLKAKGGGAHILFRPRVYYINSPIVPLNSSIFDCVSSGLQQSRFLAAGTTFRIGARFRDSAESPIRLVGSGVIGTKIKGCQFVEDQPMPKGDSPWSPYRYPPVITIDSVPGGVTMDDTTWLGIYSGVRVYHSGRFEAYRTRGQWFNYSFDIRYSYDVDRIQDLHVWNYWSKARPVLRYQLQHMDAVRLGRVDSPMIDRIFGIDLRSTIHASVDSDVRTADGVILGGGVATKVQIGTIDCDQSVYCIWNEAPHASFQINQLEGQHLDATQPNVQGLPGSADIRLDGWAFVQFGRLYTQHPMDAVVALGKDTHGCSQIFGGSVIVDDRDLNDGNLYILDAPACAAGDRTRNIMHLAAPPLRFVGHGALPVIWQTAGSHGLLKWAEPSDHR